MVKKILLIAVFLSAANAGYCGTVPAAYKVANWPGFRTAAVSYTYDDGCSNQFAIAIPMFNEFNYDLTMFTVTGWGPNWTALQNASSAGHEIASHTVTHANLGGLTIEAQTAELANSKNAVNSHITDSNCVTIAYPYCATGNKPLCAQYYFAARGCQGSIEGNSPGDFMNLSSIACGSVGLVKTAADFTARFESTASSKGWCVFLIHGIDNDGGYSPLPSTVLRAGLDYLDARRDIFWVSTFGNVARYIKERNDVSVTELSVTDSNITLQVTDTLDNAIYNYPVTIRRLLPVEWGWGPFVNVSQNGRLVNSSIVEINFTKYVMFDVVPDGGNVMISKGIYGDFTRNNAVDIYDLAEFSFVWLLDYCELTDGLDVDGNCFVNFNEFAFLAQNWMLIS